MPVKPTGLMFKGNQAGTYGPNIAGMMSTLDLLLDVDYLKLMNITKRMLLADEVHSR
jgi:hypothetical protein